ncbi:MAG: HD domain-containing protein [Acidobacteriaceae bacterium]|jgi:putative nucleotidyltransferase with HDIG domain|nr:HD domain-containing protein [Acidobacteriaceae bacterium]
MSGRTAARDAYSAVMHAAHVMWTEVIAGEHPHPQAARRLVSELIAIMSADRATLMALASHQHTHARNDDHMVNVAALTLLQADAFGIGGPLLVDFGIAALLHDIGKTRTPRAILDKPGRLDPDEVAIMQRHVLDGEQILRTTPGMPPLAARVAFEHHLRQDGSGYPTGLEPRRLNVCTSMVVVADVFDALRANRPYREGLDTLDVHDIMNDADACTFDPHLLRHFVDMLNRSLHPPHAVALKLS